MRKNGKTVAVLVPPSDLEALGALEDRLDLLDALDALADYREKRRRQLRRPQGRPRSLDPAGSYFRERRDKDLRNIVDRRTLRRSSGAIEVLAGDLHSSGARNLRVSALSGAFGWATSVSDLRSWQTNSSF